MRTCHYCGISIPNKERAIKSIVGSAWAHFECWYDGSVFPRDPNTGERLGIYHIPDNIVLGYN